MTKNNTHTHTQPLPTKLHWQVAGQRHKETTHTHTQTNPCLPDCTGKSPVRGTKKQHTHTHTNNPCLPDCIGKSPVRGKKKQHTHTHTNKPLPTRLHWQVAGQRHKETIHTCTTPAYQTRSASRRSETHTHAHGLFYRIAFPVLVQYDSLHLIISMSVQLKVKNHTCNCPRRTSRFGMYGRRTTCSCFYGNSPTELSLLFFI